MIALRDVERIGPDAAAFEPFEREDRPVVIEGALEAWPAMTRWTPAYLGERIGDVTIRVKRSATSAHPNFAETSLAAMFATETCSFRGFVTSLPEDASGTRLFTGDEKFVLRQRDGVTTIDPELGPLLDDVSVPAVIAPDRLYTIWAWFSGAGVRTGLHYDNNGCHNLNAQIAGTKDCFLVDPSQVDRCELFPAGGPNPATNCSRIDFAAPGAFADVRASVAHLGPGDLLFIPAWWLHAFRHTGAFNANINFWWKPDVPRDNAVSRRDATLAK
ncbi:MAG TPA: cupin-like domain-containing protein [Kofleriaceae bacterium]|nr:cupin-like domain-containing protein [Kofleriaceae bacterium]